MSAHESGQLDEQLVLRAAELAAFYSAGREAGAVEVDITRRTTVRRIPGGQLGLVNYHPEWTLRVEPRGPQRDEEAS